MTTKKEKDDAPRAKEYKTAKDFVAPDPMKQAQAMIGQLVNFMPKRRTCHICGNPVDTGDYIEYYDSNLGLIVVCRDCTVKAVDYYIKVARGNR